MKKTLIITLALLTALTGWTAPQKPPQGGSRPAQMRQPSKAPQMKQPSKPQPRPKPAARRPEVKPRPVPPPPPPPRRLPPPPPRTSIYFYPRVVRSTTVIVNPQPQVVVVQQPQTVVVQQPAAQNFGYFANEIKEELVAIYNGRGVKQTFSIEINVKGMAGAQNSITAEVEAVFTKSSDNKKIGVITKQTADTEENLARLIAKKIADSAALN